MSDFDYEKFKDYVNTYDKQIGYKSYSEETIINDMLYGIGICLDEDEYKFGDGYARFRIKLLDIIKKKLEEK